MPDSRHLIVPSRDIEFGRAGIWQIDDETGSVEVLFAERFLQAIRLSPDGSQVAMMRTFNDDPAQNGVWTLDVHSGELRTLSREGSYRWGADSTRLWFLEMTPTGAGDDRLVAVDITSDNVVQEITLNGQILNDNWEISPDGSYAAYWRYEDGQIVVQELR
jgi:Tol biopolymer transport system component